jgi:hypothetical protein
MRNLIKFLPVSPLLLLAQPVYAHPGHGIEYSLTTLVILVAFIALLFRIYNKH